MRNIELQKIILNEEIKFEKLGLQYSTIPTRNSGSYTILGCTFEKKLRTEDILKKYSQFDREEININIKLLSEIECLEINTNSKDNIIIERITNKGYDFLEDKEKVSKIEITNPEEIAPELKEISKSLSSLNQGQQEIIKLLASHVDILDEIRFLEADEVTIMKEKLIKLRNEDKGNSIPWDTIINFMMLITSMISK